MPGHEPIYFLEPGISREHVLEVSTKEFETAYLGICRVTDEAEILDCGWRNKFRHFKFSIPSYDESFRG